MRDEIRTRKRTNLQKYRSFQEMLEQTLERYRKGAITAAEVLHHMMAVRQEMLESDRRREELGLNDEELAFLDALEGLGDEAYDIPFLCDLVREIVESVKKNLRVDWTKPHRENVRAAVVSSVKMVLRKRKVKREQFQFILHRVMQQAEALYHDWPMRA